MRGLFLAVFAVLLIFVMMSPVAAVGNESVSQNNSHLQKELEEVRESEDALLYKVEIDNKTMNIGFAKSTTPKERQTIILRMKISREYSEEEHEEFFDKLEEDDIALIKEAVNHSSIFSEQKKVNTNKNLVKMYNDEKLSEEQQEELMKNLFMAITDYQMQFQGTSLNETHAQLKKEALDNGSDEKVAESTEGIPGFETLIAFIGLITGSYIAGGKSKN